METSAVALAGLGSVLHTKNAWSKEICWRKSREVDKPNFRRDLGIDLTF